MNLLSPLPLDPDSLPFLSRLNAALVAEVYKQSRAALAAMCLLLVFVRIIVDEAVSKTPYLHWIFVAMVVVIVARMIWVGFLIRFPERFPSFHGRHLAFAAGTTVTSACFVALNVVVFPLVGPIPLALLCVCEAGITSTAMVSMAGSPLAYMLYLLPILGSLVLMGILHPLPVLAHAFVYILFSYTLTLVGVSLMVHRTLRDNILLHLKLGDMALRDVLTGLRNRRYLEEFMEAEVPRLLRSWHPSVTAKERAPRSLTIIMLDLDHFKAVNDTHGHPAGDEVLKQVAQLLRDNTRKPDLLVRWGGEEFVILVLDAPRSLPMIAANRIREAVAKHAFCLPSGEVIQKTCSIGYAHFPFLPEAADRLDWEQVLNLADGALYQAKLMGRNRTIGVFPGEAPAPQIAEALQDGGPGLPEAVATDLLRLTD